MTLLVVTVAEHFLTPVSDEPGIAQPAREAAALVLDDESVYRTHGPTLLRHLRFLVGDAALAEDLLQETFASAFMAKDRFRHEASMLTWLRTIAVNHARRRARREKLRAPAEGAAELRQALPAATDERARQAQLLRRMDAALARLSPEQREAFVLRVIERVPLADCSEITGVPVSTISARAKAAEAKIREVFRDDAEASETKERPS